MMYKVLQAKLQQYINQEFPDIKAGFRKVRGTRDQIANIHWITEKAREFKKKHLHLIWTMPEVFTVWMTTNYGKFLKRCTYQISLAASWEICRQIKKHQLELNMEQCTSFKLGKEYIKAVYCYVAYLTYIQSTSCEMPGWMKPKQESGLPGEISITSDMLLTPHIWQKVKNS